jgi:hypothetical protein
MIREKTSIGVWGSSEHLLWFAARPTLSTTKCTLVHTTRDVTLCIINVLSVLLVNHATLCIDLNSETMYKNREIEKYGTWNMVGR